MSMLIKELQQPHVYSETQMNKIKHAFLFESMQIAGIDPLQYYEAIANYCEIPMTSNLRDLYDAVKALEKMGKLHEVGLPVHLLKFLLSLTPEFLPDTFEDLVRMEEISRGRDRIMMTVTAPPKHLPALFGQMLVGKNFKMCTVVPAPMVQATYELRLKGINPSTEKCLIFDLKTFIQSLAGMDFMAATKYMELDENWNKPGRFMYFGTDCAQVKVS